GSGGRRLLPPSDRHGQYDPDAHGDHARWLRLATGAGGHARASTATGPTLRRRTGPVGCRQWRRRGSASGGAQALTDLAGPRILDCGDLVVEEINPVAVDRVREHAGLGRALRLPLGVGDRPRLFEGLRGVVPAVEVELLVEREADEVSLSREQRRERLPGGLQRVEAPAVGLDEHVVVQIRSGAEDRLITPEIGV